MIEIEGKDLQEIWDEIPYDTRLAATLYVMEKIWEHANESASYRYLIYERLGFDIDAYSYLFPVGMNISNEFDIKEIQSLRQKDVDKTNRIGELEMELTSLKILLECCKNES